MITFSFNSVTNDLHETVGNFHNNSVYEYVGLLRDALKKAHAQPIHGEKETIEKKRKSNLSFFCRQVVNNKLQREF